MRRAARAGRLSMGLSAADRVELLDLVHRYAALVDDRDTAGAAALFTADAELRLPAPPDRLDPVHVVTGRDAVREALGRVGSVLLTVHAVAGVVLDPADSEGADSEGADPHGVGAGSGGDGATGRVTATAHHVTRSGEELRDVVWHLQYRDRYVRVPEVGWRFAARAIHLDLVETRRVSRARVAEHAAPS